MQKQQSKQIFRCCLFSAALSVIFTSEQNFALTLFFFTKFVFFSISFLLNLFCVYSSRGFLSRTQSLYCSDIISDLFLFILLYGFFFHNSTLSLTWLLFGSSLLIWLLSKPGEREKKPEQNHLGRGSVPALNSARFLLLLLWLFLDHSFSFAPPSALYLFGLVLLWYYLFEPISLVYELNPHSVSYSTLLPFCIESFWANSFPDALASFYVCFHPSFKSPSAWQEWLSTQLTW